MLLCWRLAFFFFHRKLTFIHFFSRKRQNEYEWSCGQKSNRSFNILVSANHYLQKPPLVVISINLTNNFMWALAMSCINLGTFLFNEKHKENEKVNTLIEVHY